MVFRWIFTSIADEVKDLASFTVNGISHDSRVVWGRFYNYFTQPPQKTQEEIERDSLERKAKLDKLRQTHEMRKVLFEAKHTKESAAMTQSLADYKEQIKTVIAKMNKELDRINNLGFFSSERLSGYFNSTRREGIQAEKTALDSLLSATTFKEFQLLARQTKENPNANFNQGFGTAELLENIVAHQPENTTIGSLFKRLVS